MADLTIAHTILDQLGGREFLACTGSKNLVGDNKSLTMRLVQNKSKANQLKITLSEDDLYRVEFFKQTPGKINLETGEYREPACKTIRLYEGVYFDMLQDIFEETTGLYVTLYPRK